MPTQAHTRTSTSQSETWRWPATISLSTRKTFGMYFTEGALCEKVCGIAAERGKAYSRIIDPACGIGNLLVAYAKFAHSSQTSTEAPAVSFIGIDIYEEMPYVAERRLLEELARSNSQNAFNLDFRHTCFFSCDVHFSAGDLVITNPPFGPTLATGANIWANGKVDKSASFIDAIIQRSEPGVEIVAILPDSLLSGPRYRKWREHVASNMVDLAVSRWGRFSKDADIDVFILKGTITKHQTRKKSDWLSLINSEEPKSQFTIGDVAQVSVGNIVPHRHDSRGQWKGYIDVKTSKPWTSITPNKSIRTTQKTVEPPFVVVRRTSSPSDKKRVVATLVKGDKNCAAENHLIIIKPKDNDLSTCEEIIKILKQESTDLYINSQNRCRHLTVGNIKGIPLND